MEVVAMKKLNVTLFSLVLLGTVLGVHCMEQTVSNERPHIVLHVDINKTLIAESQRKGFDFDKGIAALLSTAPEYAHTWTHDSEKTTYSKWVNEKLFPGSSKDPVLKKKCEIEHAAFIEAARKHNHPLYQELSHEFNSLVNSLKNQNDRSVFTSFSNLIKYLKERNYSFSIVLRTFGKDLDWVSKELAQDGLDNFIYGSFSKGILTLNNTELSNPTEIASVFEPGNHYAIQDSYDWWKQHNFTEKGGKPFPIDVSNKQVLSIFFDDNADDAVKPILNVIPFETETNLNELLSIGRVVPVDTRKAILDKNYYINAFEKALEKW
jgi:hypothetical protein